MNELLLIFMKTRERKLKRESQLNSFRNLVINKKKNVKLMSWQMDHLDMIIEEFLDLREFADKNFEEEFIKKTSSKERSNVQQTFDFALNKELK
jgi:hypothetical protein